MRTLVWKSEICGLLTVLAMTMSAHQGVCAQHATACVEDEKSRLANERGEKILDYLLEAQMGRFVINGEIVDQNEHRLKGVRMDAKWCVQMLPDAKYKRKESVIDGVFQIDIKDAKLLSLEFSKDGYYSANTNFAIPEVTDDLGDRITHAVLKGERPKIEKAVCKAESVRVVMEKKGNTVLLVDFVGSLEYLVGGKGKVIDFSKPPVVDKADEYLVAVHNLHLTNQLPRGCVYLTPELDPDGSIALVTKTNKLAGRSYYLPKKVFLTMNESDGGFILARAGDSEKGQREMKKAPETGYQKNLELDADTLDTLLALAGHSVRQFFFFKCGDKYGKGQLVPSDVLSKDHRRLRMGVKFRLQPDGSRNLETGE